MRGRTGAEVRLHYICNTFAMANFVAVAYRKGAAPVWVSRARSLRPARSPARR
jgi:hypothetical protein